MSDFAPPSGPPPPKVPEGWRAVWNDTYKEWFYVNLHTKESTWEKPTAPAPRPGDNAPPGGPPPGYSSGPNDPQVSDTKIPLESNNPYNRPGSSQETDEHLARRLQQEEEQRNRGASDSYYQNSSTPNPPGISGNYPGGPSPQPLSPGGASSGKKGFLGKLLGKASGGSHSPSPYGHQSGYPQQPHGYGGGYPQQGYGGQPGYGGYPPQGYGGYGPGPGYGGPGGYGGGYGGYGQPAKRRGGGLGGAGGLALGAGAGLLGGALIADSINDSQQDAYAEGYNDGADGGDFDGGDF